MWRWLQGLGGSLLAGAVPLHQMLLHPNLLLLERDHILIWLPSKFLLAKGIKDEGAIPLWNHFSEGGMPFWADTNNSALFPLNLALLPFDSPFQGMIAFLFLTLMTSYLGALFFFRTLRLPWQLALVAAFLLPWSGVALSSLNLIHLLSSQAMAPFYFAFLLRWFRQGRMSDLIAASFFLGMPIYAGDPQISYVCGGISFAWFCARRFIHRCGARKELLGLGSMALSSLLLACAQLLPSIDMASQRTSGLRPIAFEEADMEFERSLSKGSPLLVLPFSELRVVE